MKLPNDFDLLTTEEQKVWVEIKECLDHIETEFNLLPGGSPNLNNFHIVSSKSKHFHVTAYTVQHENLRFTLCLIRYSFKYNTAGPFGGRTHLQTDTYGFGHIKLNKDYGTALIRPETIADKISEVFTPIEIDFDSHPTFSYKYFVVSKDSEKFTKTISKKLLDFLSKTSGLEIEFQNRNCLFRLPKSLNKEETLELCKIGLTLDHIFNHS